MTHFILFQRGHDAPLVFVDEIRDIYVLMHFIFFVMQIRLDPDLCVLETDVDACPVLVFHVADNFVTDNGVHLSPGFSILGQKLFPQGLLQSKQETLSHVQKVGRLDAKFVVSTTNWLANVRQKLHVGSQQLKNRVKVFDNRVSMFFRVGNYFGSFWLQDKEPVGK